MSALVKWAESWPKGAMALGGLTAILIGMTSFWSGPFEVVLFVVGILMILPWAVRVVRTRLVERPPAGDRGAMKRPRTRTVLIALLAIAAALAAPYFFMVGVLAYDVGHDYLSRTAFDAAAWQDSARAFSRDHVRIRMIEDLLQRHDLDGRTRAEAVALLGEPDDTPYFSAWDMVYWLGPERGPVSIDSEWLVLRLDEGQRVVEHRVVTD